MAEKYYNPLSDTSRIKDTLMSLFRNSEDITRLVMPALDNTDFSWEENWYGNKETLPGHCFDTSYIDGLVSDGGCGIFVETYLPKIPNQHIKEVGVDIAVICHANFLRLSEEDDEYFNEIGIYGNRVDRAVQVINASILSPEIMGQIKDDYAIGSMNLAGENPLKQYIYDNKFYGKCLSYTYQTFYNRKTSIR